MTAADILDLVLLAVIAYNAVKGLFRGLCGEIFSFVGILGGIYVAVHHTDIAAAFLHRFAGSLDPSLIRIISMVALFFAVMIAATLLEKLFSSLIRSVALGSLNHICGFLLGIFKGAVVVVFLVMLLIRFQNFLPSDLTESRVVQAVSPVIPMIDRYIEPYFPSQLKYSRKDASFADC